VKISILTPDISHNCLGRAYLLAKVLQRRYEVEIVGPAFQGKIWEPLAGQGEVELRIVPGSPLSFKTVSQMIAIRKEIAGDLIYASKPLLTSYGVGLLEKRFGRRPLVLDIDDWQMGFQKEALQGLSPMRKLRRFAFSTLCFSSPASYWNCLLGERLIALADEVTVSNNFLKDRFGGTVVWHGRDTNAFDPKKFDRNHLRNKFGIPEDKRVVMFLGTPNPYKGIEDLIEAVNFLKDSRILLTLVGLGEDSYSQRVKALVRNKLSDNRARLFGLQPFKKVPGFLAISDVVVIPQRRNLATIGQVPAKVFDAMAMAKPIISTNVSDIPTILHGCGFIVEPGNPQQLARKLRFVLENENLAAQMGAKAREKCAREYSWANMEERLLQVFSKFGKPGGGQKAGE